MFINVGVSLSRAKSEAFEYVGAILYRAHTLMFYRADLKDLITSIRGYIALAMATKGRLPPTALWNPTAHPRITLFPQVKN